MDKFDETEDFKQLLDSYEEAKQQGKTLYLDSDDYADISEHYLQEGQLEEALIAANDGLEIHKDDENLLSLKINALISLNSFKEAEEMLDMPALDNDIDVYYFRAQLECALYRDYKKADEYFAQWMKLERKECKKDDDENKTRLREAYQHIVMSLSDLKKEDDDVTPYIKSWVERYIKDCNPVPVDDIDLSISRLCHEEGMLLEAIELYKMFLDCKPYYQEGWGCLASLQSLVNAHEDAINSAEFSLAIKPDDAMAWVVRSINYFAMENYAEAEKGYRKAIELTGDKSYYMFLANCLMYQHKIDEADKYLEEAKKYARWKVKDPLAKSEMYAYIAEIYMNAGLYEDALKMITKALKYQPDKSQFYYMKGVAEYKLGKERHFFLDFIKSVLADDYNIDTIMAIAFQLCGEKQWDMALYFFKMAARQKTDPNHVKAYVYAARCAYRMHDRDEFLKNVELACKFTPNIVASLWSEELAGVRPEGYFDTIVSMYDSTD